MQHSLEKSAIRQLYESVLDAHRGEITAQVRTALGDPENIDETWVQALSECVIRSLLASDDSTLAAYFGDVYPAHLLPQADPDVERLRRFQPERLQ
jgi:hypothetical protein